MKMRRAWRWRLCAASWLAGGYIGFMALLSIINMSDSSFRRSNSNVPAEVLQPKGTWGMTIKRRAGGGAGRMGARLPWCKSLRFRRPPGPNTALVSFPGSGNTWLRYLLQQSTGIYTGSVYKDYALLKNGFPAESINNGSVIVVKTHEWGPEIRKTFARVILVLRDPYQSILAEFNRQSGGHIGHAPSTKYKKDQGKYWNHFSRYQSLSWMNTTLDWLSFQGPIHLVFYDDLLENLEGEMRGILEFLELNVNERDFACMMRYKDGIYKRKKRQLPFEPFNGNLKNWVERCRHIVDRAIREFLAGSDMTQVLPKLTLDLNFSANFTKRPRHIV